MNADAVEKIAVTADNSPREVTSLWANASSMLSSPTDAHIDAKEAERLGRMRPAVFQNVLMECGFIAAILLSMIMAEFLISGFNVLLPNLMLDLDFTTAQKTWPSSVFSLVAGAFLFPFGRLSDMYGGFVVFLCGNIWMAVWSLVGGFSQNYIMLIVCRALQGLGAAAYLPAGVSLLGSIYRPGRRKNLVFSLYGGCAPFGFFTGIFIAGVSGQFLHWRWFFWIGTILLVAICFTVYLCVPRDLCSPRMPMDWWGCATLIPGLMLLVYAITDSPHVDGSWATPQIIVTFVLGVVLLFTFVYVEGWVAEAPLLPAQIFRTKHLVSLFCCLFVSFGGFGIFLLYASFYIETILHKPPILAAAWFAPLAIGGVTIALLGGLFLHRISGTILLLASALGFFASLILFAFIPASDPNYWSWVFPAMICATIGVDIMFNVANIFITTNVRANEQGIAGACVNGLLFLGMSFFLGWAELIAARHGDQDPVGSLRVAFWVGVGCAGTGALIALLGVRIGKAKGDITADERERLAQATPGSNGEAHAAGLPRQA